MQNSSSELIKPKNLLNVDVKINSIIDKVKEEFKTFQNFSEYKINPEFIKYICSIVENEITEHKKNNINKLDVAIKVMNNLFGNLTDLEKKQVETIINFLHTNKKIKKVGFLKLAFNFGLKFLKSL